MLLRGNRVLLYNYDKSKYHRFMVLSPKNPMRVTHIHRVNERYIQNFGRKNVNEGKGSGYLMSKWQYIFFRRTLRCRGVVWSVAQQRCRPLYGGMSSDERGRVGERMARVPKTLRGKISVARCIHCSQCCPKCFIISFARHAFLYCEEFVYLYTYQTAWRFYMKCSSYKIILPVNDFTQIGSGAKCWLDIYYWGAGPGVIGPIRDIVQNVLQSYFQTGSGSSPSYFQISFLIKFLEQDFIRDKIIIRRTDYNNNNSAIINKNRGKLQDLI